MKCHQSEYEDGSLPSIVAVPRRGVNGLRGELVRAQGGGEARGGAPREGVRYREVGGVL